MTVKIDNGSSDSNTYEHVWLQLYTAFNDDNPIHAENAFISQGYVTQESIRLGCIEFLKGILKHGHTIAEIEETVPDTKKIILSKGAFAKGE